MIPHCVNMFLFAFTLYVYPLFLRLFVTIQYNQTGYRGYLIEILQATNLYFPTIEPKICVRTRSNATNNPI